MESQENELKSFELWLNNLQLNNKHRISFKSKILKYIQHNFFIILLIFIITFPFIAVDFTNILYKFTYYIKYSAISKDTFLSFLGSYFGGLITFIGVILTIKYSLYLQKRQESINEIKNECLALLNLIKTSNIPQFCNTKLSEFYSSIASKQEEEHIILIINDMNSYINTLQHTLIDITITIDAFNIDKKCATCKNKCNLYKIKYEFIKIFNEYKDENIKLIYDIINIFQEKLHIIKMKNLQIQLITSLSKEKLNDQIKNIENEYENINKKIKKINNDIIINMNKYNKEYLKKMTTLIKLYRYEKIKNITYI